MNGRSRVSPTRIGKSDSTARHRKRKAFAIGGREIHCSNRFDCVGDLSGWLGALRSRRNFDHELFDAQMRCECQGGFPVGVKGYPQAG
jgi:hypothetical protein